MNVVLRPDVARDDRVEVARIVRRWLWLCTVLAPEDRTVELRDHVAHEIEGVAIVECEMIGYSRHARMYVGAAQLLGRDVDARGRFHEWGPADKDRPLSLDDDRFFAHCGNVGAACR